MKKRITNMLLIVETIILLILIVVIVKYKYNENSGLNIVGSYCTVDPTKDANGEYLVMERNDTYCLYTQKSIIETGIYENIGDNMYALTTDAGEKKTVVVTRDGIYYVVWESVKLFEKFNPTPIYFFGALK